MKKASPSMSWQLKVVGLFMVVSSILGGALVTFVLPSNGYLSSVLLLMLGLLFVCGTMTLVVGFIVAYRALIARSVALPAIIISRLLGRG